jgi:hypothetical protein
MIDQLDTKLAQWAGGILGETDVAFAPPQPSAPGRGVSLYLMEIVHTPVGRGVRLTPLQIILRYLVTTWAKQSEEAHRMLGELVFAALANTEFEVEQDPLPISAWAGFGVPPRPSFILRVPLRQERPEKRAPLVQHELVVKAALMRSLSGLVLGPGNIPLMNARVELPALQLATETDSSGRFYFAAVPAQPPARQLRVRARGQEVLVTMETGAPADAPLVIHLQLTEE